MTLWFSFLALWEPSSWLIWVCRHECLIALALHVCWGVLGCVQLCVPRKDTVAAGACAAVR